MKIRIFVAILITSTFFYLTHKNSIFMYLDLIRNFSETDEQFNAFAKTNTFADIAAFVTLLIPVFLTSFICAVIINEQKSFLPVIITFGYVVILMASLSFEIGIKNTIRWSDIVAYMLTIPTGYLATIFANSLPNNSLKSGPPKDGGPLA